MKILQITAGAATMYCGSCLRDNTLAVELMAMGHDVLLLPFYTPTLTDERNVSANQVFFSGISVYLEQNFPFFRHTPRFVDRIWESDFALRAATKRSISVDPKQLGEMTVSMLRGQSGPLRKEFEKLKDWLEQQPAPDIVSLPYTLLSALAAPLRESLRRPVACTLQGEDFFLETLPEPYRSESLNLIRENAKHVDLFLAVSGYSKELMADYLGLAKDRIEVVPLGINLDGYGPVVRDRRPPFRIGYLARITPEKGLHRLCEAFRILCSNPAAPVATLEAAGYVAPEHTGYLKELERHTPGLTYHGALDRVEKARFLKSLDVFSVPTVYKESKGIFLLEAMANGVPVVQPRQGSFPEILEKTGGGLLVDADSPEALADGILRLLTDSELARRLSHQGAAGVAEHYPVRKMAEGTIAAFQKALAGPGRR